jgi:DM9 repeat
MKWSHAALAILAPFLCLGMNPQRLAAADWRWVDATPDHLPFDAIVGGRDATGDLLYICRASHQNGMYPGKFRPGFQGCNIGSGIGSGGGNEIAVPNFQILVPPCEASSNGNVFRDAPVFGHEDPNAGSHPLFVCRANHQGNLHPGWVNPGSGGCHIGYDGKEFVGPAMMCWSPGPLLCKRTYRIRRL